MEGILIGQSEVPGHQAEADGAARTHEELFQESFAVIFERSAVGIVITELDGRFVRTNRAFQLMLGYTKEELQATTFQALTHPDDLANNMQLHVQLLEMKIDRYQLEKRYWRRDGQLIWGRISVSTIPGPRGEARFAFAVVEDFTERKLAEEALAERVRISVLGDEIGHALTQQTTLPETLQRCTEALVRHLDAALARIWLVDPDDQVLHLQASAGIDTNLNGTYRRVPVGSLNIGRIAQERRPHVSNNVRHDPAVDDPAWTIREGMESFAGYPLIVENQLLGVMALFARHPLSDLTLEALAADASWIALGIKRAQAEAAFRESEEQYRSVFEETRDGVVISDLNGSIVEANPAFCQMHGYGREEIIGLAARRLLHSDYEHIITEVSDAVRGGGQFETRALHRRKDGTTFYVQVHGSAFAYKGAQHILGVIQDITEQVEAYQLLEQRVQERTREIERRRVAAEGLRDILTVLNSPRPVNEILEYIIGQACRLQGTGVGAIFRLDEARQILTIRAAQGLSADFITGMEIPVGRGYIGRAAVERSPVLVQDLSLERIEAGIPDELQQRALRGRFREKLAALIAIPLIVKGSVYGVMVLYYTEPHEFSTEEIDLTVSLADQAALAIENARLYGQARQLAALEERQRLARELHDSVSQALYGIALGARSARNRLMSDPRRAAEPLDYVLSLAEDGMAEMRALIFELRPESLETEGLVAALLKQTAALRARHSLEVQTVLEAEPQVSTEFKEALYRVAQEALQNTVKHAHATRVVLELRQIDRDLIMEISDNGTGFDTAQTFPGHLGLHSMQERMTRLGGSCQVESEPAGGTRIRVQLPLSGNPEGR